MQQRYESQRDIVRGRLPWVIGLMILASVILLFQVASFQWLSPEVDREFKLRGQANYQSTRRLPAQRGLIYDRDGLPLAFNSLEYGIGVSPSLIVNPEDTIPNLASILELDGLEVLDKVRSNQIWVQIARPVSAEMGQMVADEIDEIGITIEPIPTRFYPQGSLAAHVLGFLIESDNGDGKIGANGVEGKYENQLAGRVVIQEDSTIPFDLPDIDESERITRGKDIVLTIDRDIQYWVEAELQRAIEETNASAGTIILMDPNNGNVLALANAPSFDLNTFTQVEDQGLYKNAAISDSYEPGSILKVLTVAGALEQGTITPEWTYNDQGEISVGGVVTRNSDNRIAGIVNTEQVLVQSLNVGTVTIGLSMEEDGFYGALRAFGLGQPTGIDLVGEENGILKVPGDEDWVESDFAANTYGQALAVTPIQMITAISAIANDGLMMQPRVVKQIIDGDEVIESRPSALGRPISAQTARIVTNMMIRTVQEGATEAKVEGYTVAGKTGTAQIPSGVGYEPDETIMSFVGFLPADDPRIVFLIKLERPDGNYASEVVAPIFRRLAERMVLLFGIPDDATRHSLQANSGL